MSRTVFPSKIDRYLLRTRAAALGSNSEKFIKILLLVLETGRRMENIPVRRRPNTNTQLGWRLNTRPGGGSAPVVVTQNCDADRL